MENSSWDDRDARARLLGDTDLPPVQIINPQGRSSFLLVGDHAGTAIPAALGTLGLSSDELGRHIAVDIGILALGEALAAALDATFICQHYSRLVIDCNRDPETQDAMPDVSDGTIVSGNAALSAYDRERRIAEIHTPYQAEIARCLAQADASGGQSILVSLHSFTPTLGDVERQWEIGILYDAGATRFAIAMRDALRSAGDIVVGDNEPYRMDSTDYTVPRHAYPLGRPYAELEVRQDLIGCEAGVAIWSRRIANALSASLGAS